LIISHKERKGRFEVPVHVAMKITFSWNMKSCTTASDTEDGHTIFRRNLGTI